MPISTTYTISNTQGTLTFQLTAGSANGPNELEQRTDLTFYGYGRVGWGQQVDQNFYSLLENFACTQLAGPNVVPNTKAVLGGVLGINDPVVGQLWFNLTGSEMYVCTDAINNTWRHLVSETYADTKYLSTTSAGGTYLKLDGSNSPMTGLLTLSGNPTANLHAATKQYVDTAISGVTGSLGNYVAKTGDTMTGALTVTNSANESFVFLFSETTGPTNYAEIEIGRWNVASHANIEFMTSGANPSTNYTVDSAIVATGGTPGVYHQGTLTLYGFIVSDGRTPTLANQLTNKSYVDGSISTAINNLAASSNSSYVNRAGDNMTGLLTLSGNPVNGLHAATKQYVDGFVPKSGATMTGPLYLSGDPSSAMQAATKQYVDNNAATDPDFLHVTWTDHTDLATSTYLNIWADVRSFSFFVPPGKTILQANTTTYLQIINQSHTVSLRWLVNGNVVDYGFAEGNGQNSYGFNVVVPFYRTGLTGGSLVTVTLQGYVRGTGGNVWTNGLATPAGKIAGASSTLLVTFF